MKRYMACLMVMCLMFLPLQPFAEAAAIEEGVVDEVRGPVEIVGLDGKIRAAKEGMYLVSGEMVRTGKGGFARLIIDGGSVLELHEDTRIEVMDSRATMSGGNTIALYMGRIWASIVKSDYGETSFEAETPTAVAGVRGTEFSMAVGIDGATRVGVDEGVVDVASDVGRVALESGKETTVEWNAPPSTPRHYQRSEEEWRQWVVSRQDHLIENADKLVPWIVADVKRSRQSLKTLRDAGAVHFKSFQDYARQQRLEGKQIKLTPRQRKAIKIYFIKVHRTMRELQKADRRMMSRYYLVMRIYQDTQENPDHYTPEFIATMEQAKNELQALNIRKVHRENAVIIDTYVTKTENFARKHQMGRDLQRRIPEDRRQELMRARQEYREQRP